MKSILRLSIFLLAWAALGPPRTAWAQTCATSAITLDYNAVATGSRTSYTEIVGSTSVTTNNYTSTVTGTNTNTFSVGSNANLSASGNLLVWQQNNAGVNPSTTPNVSTVTYNFSRAVSNLTIKITDIDADNSTNNFIDRITFDGYAAASGGTVIPLTSSNVVVGTNNTNQFVGSGSTATAASTPSFKNNAVTGTASSAADRASDVTVTFPSPVTRLVLTYENIAPFKTTTTNRTQTAGIINLTWCRLAPTANNITNTSVLNTANTAAVNSLSGTADGTISYTLGTLPSTNQGTLYVNGVAVTSGQVLTATQATQLSFNANPSFVGTYSFSYTAQDDAGNVSNTATYSVPVTGGAPAVCATAGKDGAATGLSGIVNTYFAGTASAAANATSIQVGASSGANTPIAVGDLLLVIQMQGADLSTTNDSNYGANNGTGAGNLSNTNFTAGTYEYVVAGSALATGTAGTITVSKLANSYTTAAATATTPRRSFQVIRIPQYSTVTLSGKINALAWNGSTGGIVAMDVAGTLNMNGQTLNAAGLGFRGGAGFNYTGAAGANTDYRTSSANTNNDTKGEGTAGTPRYTLLSLTTAPLRADNTANTAAFASGVVNGYPNGDNGKGAPGNAGGGGTDDTSSSNGINTGGAGGANGGAGGLGGWPRIQTAAPNTINTANQAIGGAAFSPVSSSRLVMGGGGGAGTSNNGNGDAGLTGIYSSGAPGGGLILVRAGSVAGTGTADASGAGGYLLDASNTGSNDGAGGGGAGGTILITATNPAGLANLTLLANGGAGSSNKNATDVSHGPGGGGGGGAIFTNGTVASASATGGAAGTVTSKDTYTGTAYGAKPGSDGVTNTAISNSIANSTAGANCIADVTTTITGPTTANAGSTVSLSVSFSNIGAQTATSVNRTVTLPAGVLNPVASGSSSIAGSVATGYTITYPANISLTSGASNTYTITYTAPASGSVKATSNISTATTEGGLTDNNTSSATTAIGLVADVTTALTGPQTVSPGQPTGTYTATFTNEGPSTASTVTRTVTLPAGATNVFVNGAAYTPTTANTIDFGTATTLTSGTSNAFTFSFTPATSASGTVAVTSNVTTVTPQGNNSAPDASTITAPVVPVADVATTITASPATLAAGTLATSGSSRFVATFKNNGPSAPQNVVASVQLPAGLTNVSATNGGTYNASTGVVTYPDLTSSLTNTNATVSSTITFDVPATGPVVASSSISTTTNEAGQTANNTASATLAVTPAFDLTTTITGPVSAVPGDAVTLAVTTTNKGLSAATNAVQTVQLVSGLTNVYVSNGGVYNPATTTQTLTANGVSYSVPAGGVVFPTVATLPSGQTVTNSITFSQPNAAFAPSALVTPNAASTATTAGDTDTSNNTAYLNGNTASTNITVLNPQTGTANAYTTITTSAASTTVGSPVTLTVTTGNRGPNAATGVTQLVQLVPGFTTSTLLVNNTTGTLSGNLITFGTNGPTYNVLTGMVTFPTLADGTNGSASATSVTNTITLTPSAATATSVATTGRSGRLLPMATVRTTNTDPVPADNVSSVAITLVQSADLATSIAGPASAVPGQSVTYTATFTNNGPITATDVIETAQLPAGLGTSGVTITDAAGTTVSGAAYNSATGQVTFPTLTTNAGGATQVFKLTFAAPAQSFAPSSSVNASSSDAVSTNNTASVATTVPATADLATTVAGPATAVVGGAVTYTVNTTNNGPSAATSAVTTLQLAINFTTSTLQVNGVTGTVSGNTISYNLGSAGTASYNTTSGLLTFPSLASLPVGATSSNYVTFVMPNATNGQVAGVASASATGSTDPTPNNNSASVATSIAPTTTTSADLTATVTVPAGTTTVAPGSSLTYTATYGNIGTDAATNVLPTLQLVPGLTTTTLPSIAGATGTASGNIISFSNANGTITYNTQTGVVTFPTIASQATGTTGNVSYSVQIVVPGNGPLVATAVTTSNTSEPSTALANNASSVSVAITPSFSEVTSISGPASALAGTSQTYTVTATNNGPSVTNNTTTQTVTVPAGQTPTNITNGGVYSGGVITWTIPAGQIPGANGAVANSFTIVQPAGGASLTATVQVTGQSTTNTAPITTTVTNQPPLAYSVVNALQNPQSNDAGGLATGLLISPLNASDPENSFAANKYTIVAAPDASQGTLYYSNDGTTTGTYAAVAAGQTLTNAQAQTLRFKAASSFVGNASFTYLATDGASRNSPTANYTIPVESDVEAAIYTLTPTKGGNNNVYVVGDVIAFTTDVNSAVNNASTASVYQANGTLQPGTNITSGIVAATAGPLTSSRAGVASLADLGLTLQPDGRIVVSNPGTAANPNLRSGTYSVSITTIDANGGVSTQSVSFVIPNYPLPVVLTTFTASAVQNRDAKLSWTTASEVNSAYFDVERSFDGTSFSKVGQVAAQGNTALATTYAFTDAGVAAQASGAVYYRLKQVDRDATASYSPVRTVSFTKAAGLALSLYPNPAQRATTLDLSQLPATGTYQVLVLDAAGRTVRQASLGGGLPQPLDLTELATGTYHVLVTGTLADGSALRQTLRLTKE